MSLINLNYGKLIEAQSSSYINDTDIYDDSKECEKGNFYMLLKEDYTEEREIIKVFEELFEIKIDDVVKNETQ